MGKMPDAGSKENGSQKKLNRPQILQLDTGNLKNIQTTAEPTTVNNVYDKKPGYGWRHLQFLFMFCIVAGQLSHRACLSVGIVAMTGKEGTTHGDEMYEWTREQQSSILSSFLWGYAVIHIPVGYLTTRFGAKRILGLSLALSSLITMATPLVARHTGWIGLTVVRSIMGVVQGALFPGTYTMLGKWAVPEERGRASAMLSAATAGGMFIGLSISGALGEYFGWPYIFYVFGILTFIISVLWFIVSSDSPDQHRWISNEERTYIMRKIGRESKTTSGEVPWMAILRSIPFYSALIAYSGYVYTFWLLVTALPRYIKDMFNYPLALNGVMSGVPYLFMSILSIVAGWLSDKIIKRGILSRSKTRKLFNTLGSWVPAVALLALSFTPNTYKVLQALEIGVAVGSLGCIFSGVMVNFVELSPRFSGLIFGISNFIGSLGSGVACLLVGFFVERYGESRGWMYSFCIAAALYILSGLIWILGGSSKQQPWNDAGLHETTQTELEKGSQNSKPAVKTGDSMRY